MSDERLDHETESVIEAFAVQEWLNGQRTDNKASEARDDLRSRIRFLIEEARKQGADAMWTECDTRGVPHD